MEHGNKKLDGQANAARVLAMAEAAGMMAALRFGVAAVLVEVA